MNYYEKEENWLKHNRFPNSFTDESAHCCYVKYPSNEKLESKCSHRKACTDAPNISQERDCECEIHT